MCPCMRPAGLWEKYWVPWQGWTPGCVSLGGTVTTSTAITQQADNSVNVFVGGDSRC